MRIGFVRQTLYGRMWSTRPNNSDTLAENDSTYSAEALQPHTDCSYLQDPPALQIFNCVSQGDQGGDSLYVDGFHVAQALHEQDPAAFEFLSTVAIPHHCVDVDSHMSACGPVIELDPHVRSFQGTKPPASSIHRIRFNDYDRSELTCLSYEHVAEFYRSHRVLTKLIRGGDFTLRVVLQPGVTAIINNMRVMHGRDAFSGTRELIGCYLGADELHSRLRLLGLVA